MQLAVRDIALGVLRRGIESLGIIIFELARSYAHELTEDIIDARGNSPAASEIRAEGDTHGIFSALKAVGQGAAAQENLRHRLAESVYALLYVADCEKVILIGGHGSEYQILRLVYILILVNEYFNIMFGELTRKVGLFISAFAVGDCEQIERPVQDIRKVRAVEPVLLRGILPAELLDEPYEFRHRAAQQPHILGVLRRRDAHNIRNFFDKILELFARGRDRIFRLAVIALGHAAEAHIFNASECLKRIVPVGVKPFQKLLIHIDVAAHRLAVCREHRLVGGHELQHFRA